MQLVMNRYKIVSAAKILQKQLSPLVFWQNIIGIIATIWYFCISKASAITWLHEILAAGKMCNHILNVCEEWSD